jgi:hypothetical protein
LKPERSAAPAPDANVTAADVATIKAIFLNIVVSRFLAKRQGPVPPLATAQVGSIATGLIGEAPN